ncbi:ABC transporter permease [Chloroflexi bacterium TSY]|nr:ABC transporter permease [Chloroflexi bacterium TSY]
MQILSIVRKYPSAGIGMIIISLLVGLAIYAPIALPYSEAIRLWRGGETVWKESPKNARPAWYNYFGLNLPETIVLSSKTNESLKERTVLTESLTDVIFTFEFDYTYDDFPQELLVFFDAEFDEKRPLVEMTWITPDGREIEFDDLTVQGRETYYVAQDEKIARNFEGQDAIHVLFADPNAETPTPLKGRYELQAAGLVFEDDADIDAEMIAYGQVYGLAGTDHKRRDLTVALLWGAPIALALGLIVSIISGGASLIIAAVGVWYGGWVDALIQRITEVNMILPGLSILIMIATFYSRSIFVMFGALTVLGIFSAGIKSSRALFLQIKESPFIEAAQTYGAGSMRIILRYMIPRIIPTLIPGLVGAIPGIVFTEATLSILGLGDPQLPTWGKILSDARFNGALFQGQYYWVLEPSILLMLTGLGFAMVGFALDRVFNPRLRDI